ncbi:MAG: hypothetical protein HQL06_04305 [Nitrospirae bacterium]|nr:hypothetical protein [Nitrospirota bacterium]
MNKVNKLCIPNERIEPEPANPSTRREWMLISYAVLLLVIAVCISLYLNWNRQIVSVGIGWLMGFLNYSVMRWSTKRLIMQQQAKLIMIFLNMLRMGFVFVSVIILLFLKVVTISGLLAGFALINILIIIDGYLNREGLDKGHGG